MSSIVQEKYKELIKGLVPSSFVVSLFSVRGVAGKSIRAKVILGLSPMKTVVLYTAKEYTRSLEINVIWENKNIPIIVFCSLNKSPNEIVRDIEQKVTLVVNNSYSDEELKLFENKLKYRKWVTI